MRKLIEVTQKHINKGVKGKCNRCPVALAISDTFGTPEVGIFYKNGWIDSEDDYKDFNLSRSVSRFIGRFDKLGKKAVKPFRFWLTIPDIPSVAPQE